jgi:hypothetical protein
MARHRNGASALFLFLAALAGGLALAAGSPTSKALHQGPIVFSSDPNFLIPPSCPDVPAINFPGVLCEGFDTERNGVPGFQWSRLPIGADPNDPLRALGDPNDDVLGFTMHGGPSPAGTAGVTCSDSPISYVGCFRPYVIENDWHLHSPNEGPGAGFAQTSGSGWWRPGVGQSDGGKAHRGVRSMHMGRHLDATSTLQDTVSLRQVSAFVLDSQGDPNVPGIVVGPSTSLEFWHLISVPDDENFGAGFIPPGSTFGGGQVQISLLGEDSRFSRWERLVPGLNGYDSIDYDPISLCAFDPGDDGAAPDDETMCDSPLWADLGDVRGTDATCQTDTDGNDPLHKDCGAISGCAPGPGCTETGSLGVGVWARSTFNLSPYEGRVARLRWIGMVEGGWSFGTQRSALEPESGIAYQYYDGDDGWWVDDIALTGLQRAPGPCTATDDDSDGFTECQRDCDDTRAGVYPGAPQICGDGLNNDCDDPHWPADLSQMDTDADGVAPCGGDCDDAHGTVYPGAAQVCDGLNNDCNDPTWPAPLPGDTDADADGFPVCAPDCDDANGAVYPGAFEVCGDGFNNDCNSPTWPDPDPLDVDSDGDGQSPCGGDCNDAAPTVWAGAPELCDGIRNNCTGTWDPNTEADNDQDGFRKCGPDCDDADRTSWQPPGSVDLTVTFDRSTGVTTFSWEEPIPAGGEIVLYDLLEAWYPFDWQSTVCLESDDRWDTFYEAPPVLPWPDLRFYLVRAQNGCPTTEFRSIGTDSSGFPRTGRHCNP